MSTTILYNGDCLIEMGKIEDGSVDMILCDLPYGTTACKWDSVIPFEPLWKHYERIIKDNGAIILTASQPFTTILTSSNIKLFRYELIWQKDKASGFLNANKMPLKAHENVLVFYKKLPTYNPQKTIGGLQRKRTRKKPTHEVLGKTGVNDKHVIWQDNTRYPISVLEFDVDTINHSLHPTQKPVSLMEYLIKTYTNEGETVLDNCMGSGTTGVACKNTNRNFIGIEKDEKYFDVASNRIEIVKKQKEFSLF